MKDIINIIAIIVSPIVAVVIGQYFQKLDKKRADKMEIFKTLMVNRGLGWSVESVKALNMIEVVFSDDKNVLDQWKIYYDRLWIQNPSATDLAKIKIEGDKLIEVMGESLGYKDKITLEVIQKPYMPIGMTDRIFQQQQYENAQMETMAFLKDIITEKKDPGDESS